MSAREAREAQKAKDAAADEERSQRLEARKKLEPRELRKPKALPASSRPESASAVARREAREARNVERIAAAEERKQRREAALDAAFKNKDRRPEARAMKMSRRALDRIVDGKRGPTRDQMSQLEQRHGIAFDVWDSIYIGQR